MYQLAQTPFTYIMHKEKFYQEKKSSKNIESIPSKKEVKLKFEDSFKVLPPIHTKKIK